MSCQPQQSARFDCHSCSKSQAANQHAFLPLPSCSRDKTKPNHKLPERIPMPPTRAKATSHLLQVGRPAQLSRALTALQKTWVQFQAPTSGSSQPSVIPAVVDLIWCCLILTAPLWAWCTLAHAGMHTYSKERAECGGACLSSQHSGGRGEQSSVKSKPAWSTELYSETLC